MAEFMKWPKSPRLNREVVVSEKIDGMNSGILIEPDGTVTAQNRGGLVYPGYGNDSHGFAEWVDECKEALYDILGTGRHFGEWWGAGINREYDMDHNVFSLFNTARWGNWAETDEDDNYIPNPTDLSNENYNPLYPELQCVPIIDSGPFVDIMETLPGILGELRDNGSYASPFYPDPEGIMIYHTAASISFKMTLAHDEIPKGFDRG